MRYEFKKILNNHNRLRDDIIIAHTCSKIEIGKCVVLTGRARDLPIGDRMVNTSPVVEMEKITGGTRIKTQSGSIYEIREIKGLSDELCFSKRI